MMLDLLGAVELTACAAITVAVVAIAFGTDGTIRRRLAVALGAWFAVVVALAATRALQYAGAAATPALGLTVVIPIVALSVGLFRNPVLRRGAESAPLAWLVAVHAVRLLGVSFVLLYAAGRLPAPFAPVAGWGDITVGAAALPVAWMVARRAAGWRGAVWAWNVLGLMDLVTAVALGVMSSPGPLRVIQAEPGAGLMSTLPWMIIPGFLVPVLMTTHFVIFYRLAREGRTAGKGTYLGREPAGNVSLTAGQS